MTRPVVGTVADRIYRDLAPVAWQDAQLGYPLLSFVGALGSMLQPVADLASDTVDGPGYSQLLDVDRCPTGFLPWLAQLVGVTVDPSLNDAGQRQQIRAEQRMQRGTPAAIVAAAQRHLTGQKTVILRERDPVACPSQPAYGLTVFTYTAETPDSAAVLAALEAAKPAGIILNYEVSDGHDWLYVEANYATWTDVLAHFTTWGDLLTNNSH